LPKIFNVVDIPITYAILLISFTRQAQYDPLQTASRISRRLFGFAIVLFLGAILNAEASYLPATLTQVNLLLQPILLFIALLRLNVPESAVALYQRVLKILIALQIIVGVFQLPGRLASGNSEDVHGTFPGNAEQFAAFILIGVFYTIAVLRLNPTYRVRHAAIVVAILVLIVSVDNKASWMGMAISVALILSTQGYLRSQMMRALVTVLMLGLVGTFLAIISSKTSTTLYKIEKLYDVVSGGGIMSLGKVKSYADVARSWAESPHMAIVGAGAGNMYSRSSRQFFNRPGLEQQLYRNPGQLSTSSEPEFRASDSIGGAISRTTKPAYYLRFFSERDSIVAVGSAQVDGPFSPYSGLLGETGILGTSLYLSIYFHVLMRMWSWTPHLQEDADILPLHLSALGMLIYLLVNSVYGPFIETTRYTTILWSLIALVFSYVRTRQSIADRP